MSSTLRRSCLIGSATVIVVALAATMTSMPAPAGASPSSGGPPVTAAAAGAGWIGRQFKKDAIPEKGGGGNASYTAQAVLAFVAAGVGQQTAENAITWLEQHDESYVSPGGTDDPDALSLVALAAVAMGVDPRKFGGTAPEDDLIARIEATQQTSGPDAGLFGTQDPTYDGAYRQGLALMALATQGIDNPAGVAWLQDQQCADGGWQSYRSDTSEPCDPPDPSTFTGPDTNSTTLAVEGLVAQGASFPVDPLGFFESAQNSDGGFGFIGSSSEEPDADSTGLVIQALVDLGQLHNPAFTQSGGATPMSALDTFQLGCSATKAHRGSFAYQPSAKGKLAPNMLATLQAVPGAAEAPFPLSPKTLAGGLPRLSC